MYVLYVLLLSLFSNYEGGVESFKPKKGKVIEFYQGLSNYTLLLVNGGKLLNYINPKVNIEITNITNDYISNFGLSSVIDAYSNSNKYIKNLKQEILMYKERLEMGSNGDEIKKDIKALKKLLRKLKRQDHLSQEEEEVILAIENILLPNYMFEYANIENDIKKLAPFCEYSELLSYANINNEKYKQHEIINEDYEYNLNTVLLLVIKIEEQDKQTFDFFSEKQYLKSILDNDLENNKNRYRDSEISGSDFYRIQEIIQNNYKLLEVLFTNFKGISTKIDFLRKAEFVINDIILEYSNYLLSEIEKIHSKNNENYYEIIIDNVYLNGAENSLTSLLKDKNISYLVINPKSAPF